MTKDIEIFIEYMLESINKIEEYSKTLTKEKLIKDSIIQDAIVRRIEIIGEAARNLSEAFKEKHSFIPWKEIIGTRDKIIHHYSEQKKLFDFFSSDSLILNLSQKLRDFGINLDMIWEIVTINIPDLKIKILNIKRKLEKTDKKEC